MIGPYCGITLSKGIGYINEILEAECDEIFLPLWMRKTTLKVSIIKNQKKSETLLLESHSF